MSKPKTIKQWEKVCNNLNEALHSSMADVDNLEAQIGKLEEQLTMSIGVIKYLELQIVRSNSV
jgi:wobble nucleotide-excising tRNase